MFDQHPKRLKVTGHERWHVLGYKEEGTTTTPFDMVMLNDLDRYHLVIDVIDRVPSLGSTQAGLPDPVRGARVVAVKSPRAVGPWRARAPREMLGARSPSHDGRWTDRQEALP
ncbi:XFP C-terminal domain-containing protein [Promicromonospora thailandica]|uniref:XFP C-terminal domain-containing protein n=1 Tax=Promicromonospora thailandica TaxID=765201 RepID=A0A9X2G883_9MICO|nr:XFP C-terminal domain-containing protein [Promicromonospora thailandica]